MTRKTLLARKYELQNRLRILRGEEDLQPCRAHLRLKFRQTAKEDANTPSRPTSAPRSRHRQAEGGQRAQRQDRGLLRHRRRRSLKPRWERERGSGSGPTTSAATTHFRSMKSGSRLPRRHWTVKFMSDNCIEFAVWNRDREVAFGQRSTSGPKHDYLNGSKEALRNQHRQPDLRPHASRSWRPGSLLH